MDRRNHVLLIGLIFALSAVAPAVTAGGGGGGGGGAVGANVSIAGFAYNSNNVTINVAESVEWTNTDSTAHTVTDNGAPEPFDSGEMLQGDTFSYTFFTTGNFPYACSFHSSMTGIIHVVDPGASGNENETNGSGEEDVANVSMLVWMPEGIPIQTAFDIENGSSMWQASVIGLSSLQMTFDYTNDSTHGVFLNSIDGLASDVEFGDPAWWYWGFYVMNFSSGLFDESEVGVSSLNVTNGTSFAWVATNGSWGPMEGSVMEMLASLNQEDVEGCTNDSATNYNENATIDDGSCTFDDGGGGNDIIGCTDSLAMNFIAEATADDGSCIYDDDGDGIANGDEISGCTDLLATNYNSSATDLDGSCTYDTDGDGILDSDEIAGCTNASAENYNSNATDDDGTCTFSDPTGNATGPADADNMTECELWEYWNPSLVDDSKPGNGCPSYTEDEGSNNDDDSSNEGTTTPPGDDETDSESAIESLASGVPGGFVGLGVVGAGIFLLISYLVIGRSD